MDQNKFQIVLHNAYWINGEPDNPDDRCLHGDVSVQIGDEVVADYYSCTVSSTALYLLKSIDEDHVPIQSMNQMLPCCGFFIIPNKEDKTVEITGCKYGIDWCVSHMDGMIKLVTDNGAVAIIDQNTYKQTVYDFVDKVELYYKSCTTKIIPSDEFDQAAYFLFWWEWKNRRYQLK